MYNDILGIWEIVPHDDESKQIYGSVTIEFKPEGKLIYTIHLEGKEQRMFMVYEIKDNILITNQPSSPHVEETKFRILSSGELELSFDGINSKYTRIIDTK